MTDDDDDLENTMRHGLQELANDAPRGDNLWDTTTSMIAIQAEQLEAEELAAEKRAAEAKRAAPPEPAPAPTPEAEPSGRNDLVLGIIIGVLVAALIAAVVLLVLATRDNSDDNGTSTGAEPTEDTEPGSVSSDASTLPRGPIPEGSVVFNDTEKSRIVVADAALGEQGLIVPSSDETWRAIGIAPDRNSIFVAKTGETSECDEVFRYDTQTRKRTAVVKNADIVVLSPDGTKAVVTWDASCTARTGATTGQVKIRNVATSTDTELPQLSGQFNLAWSPDGARLATHTVGSRNTVVYDGDGKQVGAVDQAESSLDGVGWIPDGMVLVDLGNEGTAVLRVYDPLNGNRREIARIPKVMEGGDHGPLVTPQVTAIRAAAGRTYVEVRGGGGAASYAQLWVVEGGVPRLVTDGWYSREFVG